MSRSTEVRSRPFQSAATAVALIIAIAALVLTASTSTASSGGRLTSVSGYRLVASDGGVFAYGDAAFYGSTGNVHLNKPIVGMAATPDDNGYWLVASDGGVFAYGDAAFYGSTGNVHLNKPIVGMAATRDDNGYWLVASDGGVFAYGDAAFYGSTGNVHLNEPIVGMDATHDGDGYWLVASDGGVFAYGDAAFYGSTGNMHLNQPIVGIAATQDGSGYWLVASDGGIFAFGDAGYFGSAGNRMLNKPIVGMAASPDGNGYWLVASDGGIFSFGDAAFYGSTGNVHLNEPIVGMATSRDGNLNGGEPASPAPTTSTAPAPAPAPMPTPAGYTDQQMIFDDKFSGTALDTTKWNTYLGAGGVVWNDFGTLPSPYSGPNIPGSGFEAAMFGPSQVSVDNGLTMTATRNSNQYSSTYPWISGVVTTEGKFSLPTTGWYVQVEAKMPDQSQGMWPSIWFLPGTASTPVNEFDGYEGGFLGSDPNEVMHSDYFADQGQQASAYSVGTDVTAGYHVYGFQFLPGNSVTAYFDGNQVWKVSAANGITITGEPYEIMLELEVATQATSNWHTLTSAGTPSATINIAEVKAFSSN
jgi:hypothetical protein